MLEEKINTQQRNAEIGEVSTLKIMNRVFDSVIHLYSQKIK